MTGESREFAAKLAQLDAQASPARWFGGHLGKGGKCECTYVLTEHLAGSVAQFEVQDPAKPHAGEWPTKEQAVANIELTVMCRNNAKRIAHLVTCLNNFVARWNARNVSEPTVDALLVALDSLRVDDTATDPESETSKMEGEHGLL
jgi:hypothetical protein